MTDSMGSTPLFAGSGDSAAELLARVRKRLAAHPPAPPETPLLADPEFDLSKSDGLLDGWFEPQMFGDRMTRWVARRFSFEADVRDATHVAIDALIFEASGLAELRGRLKANDTVGAAFRIRPGWNGIRVPIPAGVSGRVQFSIDAGGSWCPATAGVSEDDARELSLLVGRLALTQIVRLPRVTEVARPLDPIPDPFGGPIAPRRHAQASAGPERVLSSVHGSLAFRIIARFRRLFLGWDATDGIRALEERVLRNEHAAATADLRSRQEELEARSRAASEAVRARLQKLQDHLLEQEQRFNEAAVLLEHTLRELSKGESEALADARAREEDWRGELERKLRNFLEK